MQAAKYLGVGPKVEARQIEEREAVPITDIEEEMRRALIVPVLEHIGKRETKKVLVEPDGALDIGDKQRHMMHATSGRGGSFVTRSQMGGRDIDSSSGNKREFGFGQHN
jgi:hypothetical protein